MKKLNRKQFIENFKSNLEQKYVKSFEDSTKFEKYHALSETIMDMISKDWLETNKKNRTERNAFYFSAEFLIGRSLGNNLLNLGIIDEVKEILKDLDIDFDEIEDEEDDAALGNGGLGRLAACFMESGATEGLNLHGYGVRYSQGIFKQRFENGFQLEEGDSWVARGDFWSLRKESESQIVNFRNFKVKAVPYDVPVVGYKNGVVNTLRLWQSEAIKNDGFDFQDFNDFRYDESVSEKNRAEDITRVLYPNDNIRQGKLLRLLQQYFFVSASLQEIVQKYKRLYPEDKNFSQFHKYHIFQLNDTHPVIAIPELIRILLDEENLSWDDAFGLATKVFAFTNHTVLQEALEKWNLDLIHEVSPRAVDIIKEIDKRLLESLQEKGYSLEEMEPYRIVKNEMVEMAFLATYVSTSINGVAELHTIILKKETLNQWFKLYPEKFNNKTNGVTPRRWLQYSNPQLTAYIDKLLKSEDWKHDMTKLKGLEKFADDVKVLDKLNEIKFEKKVQLAKYIKKYEGIEIDPNSIFDIQIKRLHEYKRQLLNALHILHLYYELKVNPSLDMHPVTFIFGAKAAPGYFRAKGIIKFINEISKLINNDSEINGKIKVVFIQNYRVSYAEKLFPAADVSEQISTAGKEASGTGNMKFMMNGTPTLGTMDGANVEIFREAGLENNFLFGRTEEEINELAYTYNPINIYNSDERVKKVVDALIKEERISDEGTNHFLDIYNSLIDPKDGNRADVYYLLEDFASYVEAHKRVDEAYRDRRGYARKGLINIANSGLFSSDRTIKQYAEEIWKI
ncbi:glycogen/starch/alpha-glucan phosphorylase [Helcococcus ovis]|uniref:Alpha-1,4 glucan phosphorylase n=1 Tax=Helcococcus ovis TaxID=72026 RepID=A0A4R9C0T7_9FIRM|nr:glycogen/starch/alpha-glucan phosphorylase [Helcococcus ovis]TFF64003.1 glycogen/starch/alpha-glucan phosphorylase [Helcococcus ovis]TFF64370.1 glycogen/starch/alpha-glucan phosphorylase [Helcococcus ovis]